jgi:hypothetical protein
MAKSEELLGYLWKDVINLNLREASGDLCLVLRATAYEAVFGTLYSLSDPGSDEDDDVSTLYEELLMADPSGMEGRPGSADPV